MIELARTTAYCTVVEPTPTPGEVNVGGTIVVLKCDTLGYCVPSVPPAVEEGILMFPQAVRSFLNDIYGQFYVWVWPERWWPKHWPGGDDSYHRRGLGVAYYGHCEVSWYEEYPGWHPSHTTVHEIGHCLDFALGGVSQKAEWGAIQAQYWPDPGNRTHRLEQWARTVRYMYTGETGFDPSGQTWCEMYPASCVFASAVMENPWSYI